jgi:hypothetical protein
MALKQATTAIRGVDAVMGCQVNGPSRVYRLTKRDFIGHSQAPPTETTSSTENSTCAPKFPLFPECEQKAATIAIGVTNHREAQWQGNFARG